jgi:hypothetical protein
VKSDGQVTGALGASLFLDDLSDEISKTTGLPADVIFFALNPQGLTALNSKTERIFQDPTKQGSPSLTKAAREMLSRQEGAATYEFLDQTREIVYRTSPLTGWKFALGVVQRERPRTP